MKSISVGFKTITNGSNPIDVEFKNSDKRFIGELGNTFAQGWASSVSGDGNIEIIVDNVFGVSKNVFKYTSTSDTVKTTQEITGSEWSNILMNGASFSSTIRFSEDSDTQAVFTGMIFSASRDPRTFTSEIGRIGVFISEDDTSPALGIYTTIALEGNSNVILDGRNGVPIVLRDEWFHYEAVISPSQDKGNSFGEVNLYVNGVLVSTGGVVSSPPQATDIIIISSTSSTGDTVFYAENFGVTIYLEPSERLLTADEMSKNPITLITPKGKRDYIVSFPDQPRGYGDSIILIANNSNSSVTLKTENATTPTVIFNGENTYKIFIEAREEILFTNTVEGNSYEGILPHSDLHIHEDMVESFRTGMIEYTGLGLETPDTFDMIFGTRTMRFVDKISKVSTILTRQENRIPYTGAVNAPDDLGVVHFYENVDGEIFGTAKTDWSTPDQRREYVYLGNADVNSAKDGFVQANNPLVSAFGLLDTVGDILAIGGSIKGHGGEVSTDGSDLDLNISGYTSVAWGRNFGDKRSPHTPISQTSYHVDLHLGYRTSDISMFFGPAGKVIDPSQYQRIQDTVLTTVPAGKYTIQRVYQYPGTSYNMVIYGNTLYDNLEQAKLSASTERYNLHPSLIPACFLAYVIVKSGITNLQNAISLGEAEILNYDGRSHPLTIGAEESPSLSLVAGGELKSMADQYANDTTDTFIDFELGHDTLYGCEWDIVNKTITNMSQKDMVINVVPQIGRRSTGTAVGLEIFIDISYDNGTIWNADINETYTTYQSLQAQIDSLTASVLIYRVVPGATVRVGMFLKSNQTDVGIISNGEGATTPSNSFSGRQLPSCILTIT